MADMLVTGGYTDVGYDTVIIDDCWLDHHRWFALQLSITVVHFKITHSHILQKTLLQSANYSLLNAASDDLG